MKDLLTLRKTFSGSATNFLNESAVRMSLRLALFLGGLVFLGGLTGFLGWVLDINRLANWNGDGIPILPNTSVLMTLSGIAVFLIAAGRQRAGAIVGIVAGTIGFATFSQYLHGIDLGIDRLLLRGRDWGATVTVVPGRMGPPASFSWTLLLSAFLLLLGNGRSRRFVPAFAFAVMLIASVSFVGYLMGADRLYALPRLTVIAWQTSALFIALSVGLLAALPDLRPTSYLVNDSVTGMLLRRLLIPVVFIPLALGAIELAGQKANFYDTAMGTSLLVVVFIFIFLLVIFIGTASSSRFEREKRTADEIAESAAAELSLVTETASVGLYHASRDLVFLSANSTYSHYISMPMENVVGRGLVDVLGEDTVERVRPHFERALAGEQVKFEVRYPFDAAEEDQRDLQVAYSPAAGADGSVNGWVACVTDISERKRAEQALRESENRFSTMANTAPAIIWATRADGSLEFISRGWYGFTGQTEAEAFAKEGFGWLDAVHPEDSEEAGKIFLTANNKHEFFQLEYRLRSDVGEYRWAIDAGRPRFDDAASFIGFIGSVVDVHERKQAEQASEQSRLTLYNMVENAPFGIYIVDSDFRIAVINKGSQERAFANVNPAVGWRFDEAIRIIWPEDVATDVIARFRQTLETGEPYYSKGFVNPRADTNVVEGYEWEIHRMTMPDGSNGVICYYFDSTELRTAQMELADLNRNLEYRVATRTEALNEANVALNQEMNARVASEKERVSVLAKMMTAQEDERRRIAAELHDQLGQHMTALRLRLNALQNQTAGNGFSDSISQIIQIAKELDTDLDAVTLSLRPRALDTLGLAEALCDYVRKWQNKSGVAAEFHSNGYREGLLTAEAETALFRITQEALHNCTKHSKANLVNIVLGIRDGRLTLVIEDDGVGFNTKKMRNGDGLGLTSMRERCELAGGDFTIESAPKQGTTIIVTIPVK